MITNLQDIQINVDHYKVTSLKNIEGNVSDWYTRNGSFQAIFLNDSYEYGIKIPNFNHGDSAKLLGCHDINTWGRPEEEARPISKYSIDDIVRLYSLLQFHYDNGFGPKMGRIVDIEVNGSTYIGFEQERLVEYPFPAYLRELYDIEYRDEDTLNTIMYNEILKPDMIMDVYKQNNALKSLTNNHIISKNHESQNYSVGYKADLSIFFCKNDTPVCFDVDHNTIAAYFEAEFIDKIVEKYTPLISSRNYSKHQLL